MAAFLAFFRFEIGAAEVRSAAAFALAAALMGSSLGAAAPGIRRRYRALVVALAATALWAWWAAGPPGGSRSATALIAVAGFALLGGLNAAGGHAVAPFLLGTAAAFIACSAGVMGALGVAPVVVGGVALASAAAVLSAWASAGRRPAEGALMAARHSGSRLLLGAAVGAVAVALLRAYLPAVRSLAYAGSDLGIAFFLGLFVYHARLGRFAGRTGLLVICCTVAAAVSVLVGFSFFFYPDLILSESAALQTSASLLVPGRVFPLWVLAFCLGVAAGPVWPAEADRWRTSFSLAAAAAGAAASGLVSDSYRAGFVLPAALVLLALLPLCLARRRRRSPRSRALPAAACGLVGLSVIWCLAADPHLEWTGLRSTFADHLWAGRARLDGAEPVVLVSGRLEPLGLRAVLMADDLRAEFLNGRLVHIERSGRPLAAGSPVLMAALGLAFSDSPQRVALLRPVLRISADDVQRMAGGAEVASIGMWNGGAGGEFDVILSGPGPLSAVGNPLALMSLDGLGRIRRRLAEGGVFALWFPAGRLSLDTLRRAIATLGEVFPSFYVFVSGQEAVFVATSAPTLRYGGLERLQVHLVAAGFWHPVELVKGFVAEAEELAGLIDGVRPYRLSHPGRPPALGRDLAGAGRPAALAALVQHRLAGPDRLLRGLAFRSDNSRLVALRGFEGTYREQTRRILQGLGRADATRRRELLEFLKGPLASLDLFAPQGEEREVRVAAALSACGMNRAAAELLRKAVEDGSGSSALHLRLAGALEALDDPAGALQHYRAALALQPDSSPARGRMTALLLALGRNGEAGEALEELVKREPENVTALLMLGRLYAGPLARPRDAAKLLLRVLDLEPQNAAAQELLAICRQAAAAEGED